MQDLYLQYLTQEFTAGRDFENNPIYLHYHNQFSNSAKTLSGTIGVGFLKEYMKAYETFWPLRVIEHCAAKVVPFISLGRELRTSAPLGYEPVIIENHYILQENGYIKL